MDRLEKMVARDEERKQKETQEFLNNVNVLKNNSDSVVIPSVEIMKETDENYINYHVAKYPNCLTFSISMHKKDYPFPIYYSKEYYKNRIPQKYSNQFEELEGYFYPVKEEVYSKPPRDMTIYTKLKGYDSYAKCKFSFRITDKGYKYAAIANIQEISKAEYYKQNPNDRVILVDYRYIHEIGNAAFFEKFWADEENKVRDMSISL